VTDYYTMESIRNLIVGNYKVRAANEDTVFLSTWSRYPCPILKQCERKRQTMCIGYVSISVNTGKVHWVFLEICFFREKKRAFIRVNCLQMRKLFELGIISDESLLEKETF
jgi:hypothetical protein